MYFPRRGTEGETWIEKAYAKLHGDYENLTGYARVCRPNFVPFVPYLINIFRGVSATYRAKVPRSFAYPFFCLTVQV